MLTLQSVETRSSPTFQNRLLSALSDADRALLAPCLQPVALPRDHRVERRGGPLEHVYFIESGIACVLPGGGTDAGVETGMIGREGLVGVPAVLGATHSSHDVRMMVSGTALRVPVAHVFAAMSGSMDLREKLYDYSHRLLLQAMREAYINARATLDVRLSRLLLKLHDRVDGKEISLTHERIAILLGVRRAGVSVALTSLERAGIISSRRGVVIKVRDQLEARTGSAYGAQERAAIHQPRRSNLL
jgi:CRP-like cAMP-binding protein